MKCFNRKCTKWVQNHYLWIIESNAMNEYIFLLQESLVNYQRRGFSLFHIPKIFEHSLIHENHMNEKIWKIHYFEHKKDVNVRLVCENYCQFLKTQNIDCKFRKDPQRKKFLNENFLRKIFYKNSCNRQLVGKIALKFWFSFFFRISKSFQIFQKTKM